MFLFGRLEVRVVPLQCDTIKVFENDCEMVPLTKFDQVIFSLGKIGSGELKKEPRSHGFFEGIHGVWNQAHFPRTKPSGPPRGPMTKFLFTWHLLGLGWCVEPGAFSAHKTQ